MTRGGRCVFLWSDKALYLGPAANTELHTHHAIEMRIPLNGDLDVQVPDGPTLRGVPGAIILSNTPHETVVRGVQVAILYIDPLCPLGIALDSNPALQPIGALTDASTQRWRPMLADVHAAPSLADADRACMEMMSELAAGDAPMTRPVPDARIRRAMKFINDNLGEVVTIPDLAAVTGLSSGRTRHLFRKQVGLTVRRYALWMRLRRALDVAFRGESLTNAAHEAGFADLPHFTRTSRMMFGIAPSGFMPVDVFMAESVPPDDEPA